DIPVERFRGAPEHDHVLLAARIEIPPRPIGHAPVEERLVAAIVVDGDVPSQLCELAREIENGLLRPAEAPVLEQLRAPWVRRLPAIDDQVLPRAGGLAILGVALDELLEQETRGA